MRNAKIDDDGAKSTRDKADFSTYMRGERRGKSRARESSSQYFSASHVILKHDAAAKNSNLVRFEKYPPGARARATVCWPVHTSISV